MGSFTISPLPSSPSATPKRQKRDRVTLERNAPVALFFCVLLISTVVDDPQCPKPRRPESSPEHDPNHDRDRPTRHPRPMR